MGVLLGSGKWVNEGVGLSGAAIALKLTE